MRAYVQRGFGGPGVCAFEDVPEPQPAASELVVEVRACALNRLDLLQREEPLVRGFVLPHIAGMDVAGVVARGPRAGERVLIDPVSTCGMCPRCTSGQAPYCERLRTVGSTRPGGFAEYVATPADHAYPIPEGMSDVDAATLPVAAMTAFHALEAGRFAPGETVLVNGASAGVSCAVLALAHAAGSTVITTTGGRAKVERALAAGYDHAVDYRAGDVAGAVRELTGGSGVDLVIDHVGPALFAESIRSLAIEGRMVFCGTTTGTEATLPLTDVYHWGRTLIGAGGYHAADFPRMLAAMARTTPVISAVHPFAELPEALAALESGDFFGKLVVEMI